MVRFTLRYLLEHRWQLAKFILVGGITFGIKLSMVYVFYGLGKLDYRVSVSLAYWITVICHFLLHRFFTFEAADQQMVHNLGKYLAMLGLNYAITLLMAWFVVEVLGLSLYYSVVADTAVTAITSFFVMKYFVFKRSEVSWRSS